MISSSGTTPGPEPHDHPGESGRIDRSRTAVIALSLALASVAGIVLAGFALASLEGGDAPAWLSILSLAIVASLVAALVTGIVGVRQVQRSRGGLRGLPAAVTAIVVASVLLVLGISGAVIGSVGSGPLLDDDFEGAHMWTEDDDPIVDQRFVDGGYEIELKQAGVPSVSRHFFDGPAPAKLRFTVDVTVVREAGPQYVGVQCWEGGTHGYSFVLSPDEGYALLRVNGPDDVRVLSEGPAPSYGEGETLRQITIECAGGGANSTLVVASVDGEELGRAEDPEGFDAFGAVGLWSLSQQEGGTVRWDNAKAQA